MKTVITTVLLVFSLSIGFSSCVSSARGYNYKKHHKKSAKLSKKKAPTDLTKVKCGGKRR
jgi:hypothetical protein